ncbi:hypothetical protein SAMN04488523_1552 [Sulfitobacter brevis]|uniref:Uncharacterized protein n=1 Tax=Sulfitobacter brevis TaxID=74348 RepID=A0A1I2HIV0_9RHOB|nr:hypothetical protein SAMN04488523_1552 [Sulfitobacter brevis]
MLFKQKLGRTNVTSLVKRVSRFTLILKNPGIRQPRLFAKRCWRKCDDTPTLSSTRVAVQVSLTEGSPVGL